MIAMFVLVIAILILLVWSIFRRLSEEEEKALLDQIEERLRGEEREIFRAVRRGELPFERLHPRLQRRIRSLATTLLRVILRGRKRRA
ncbi:MAG: hypothetical protein QN194_15910 [Armatimonadota bacterium]|nr:hypothetical protein [Armatimonadota bacterium]